MGVFHFIGKIAFPNLAKYQIRENGAESQWMALRFDRRLRRTAEEDPVKFQSHPLTLTIDLAASRLDQIP